MRLAMILVPAVLAAQTPPPAAQTPSPMVEHSRKHERLTPRDLPGVRVTFEGPIAKPVEVFVPEKARRATAVHLVLYFHGSGFIPSLAVSQLGDDHVVASMTLGPGSGVYDRTF